MRVLVALEDREDASRPSVDQGLAQELARAGQHHLAAGSFTALGHLDEVAERRRVDERQQADVEDEQHVPGLDHPVDALAEHGQVEGVELAHEREDDDVLVALLLRASWLTPGGRRDAPPVPGPIVARSPLRMQPLGGGACRRRGARSVQRRPAACVDRRPGVVMPSASPSKFRTMRWRSARGATRLRSSRDTAARPSMRARTLPAEGEGLRGRGRSPRSARSAWPGPPRGPSSGRVACTSRAIHARARSPSGTWRVSARISSTRARVERPAATSGRTLRRRAVEDVSISSTVALETRAFEQEPVELGLGQGVGALHLDGVLRGQDDEGIAAGGNVGPRR